MKKIESIRGMKDILPAEMPYWHLLEQHLQQIAHTYGYREIRFPLLEKTALFSRSIGAVTDIVEKEMYTFLDREGDSLSLRPEGTAGCVRAGIQASLFYQQPQRLWYIGPMYRHEKPQRGRYRQFYQFGVEAIGFQSPEVDAEHILMMARLWRELGISDSIRLEMNSLGTSATREKYRKDLVTYLTKHDDALDEDSQRRLTSNPLRVLDSKNPDMQSIIAQAPRLLNYLDEQARKHFDRVCYLTDQAGIAFTINPRLVRGLDYYCHTVYEWTTAALGSQGTVCAGGRYDGLVEQLGGDALPASGFALGMERVIELMTKEKTLSDKTDAYFVLLGEEALRAGLAIAEQIHDEIPDFSLIVNTEGGSFKSQFKKADRSQARLALVIGENEVASQTVAIKFLREEKMQITLARDKLIDFLQNL